MEPSAQQKAPPYLGDELGPSVRQDVHRNAVEVDDCTRSSPVSEAVGSLGRGTKWTALENLSTIVRIIVLPYPLTGVDL